MRNTIAIVNTIVKYFLLLGSWSNYCGCL